MLIIVITHAVFGLLATFAVYALGLHIHARLGRPAWAHPVLICTAMIASGLVLSGLDYDTYRTGTAPLGLGLSLAIVLLAVPLYKRAPDIRRASGPLGLAIFAGGALAILSAIALPLLAGGDAGLVASLAPKSATAPVATEIAAGLGGASAITAVVTIMTGVFGAVFGPSVLSALGVRDDRAAGLAMGLAAHTLGTARALQISRTAGAFATVGMILNALFTVAAAPYLVRAFS